MCKSGVSGNDYKVETVPNELSRGDITDNTQGFTSVLIHLNMFLGTAGGLIVILVIIACTLVVCA